MRECGIPLFKEDVESGDDITVHENEIESHGIGRIREFDEPNNGLGKQKMGEIMELAYEKNGGKLESATVYLYALVVNTIYISDTTFVARVGIYVNFLMFLHLSDISKRK